MIAAVVLYRIICVIVDLFLTEWHKLVGEMPSLDCLQRMPHKVRAYTWLNMHYFRPKVGEPRSVDEVSQLVHGFINMVRYGQLSPVEGVDAWQFFVFNVSKITSSAPVSSEGRYEIVH